MRQNAGPASVMPHEFDTMARGSRRRRVSKVAGASGALPSGQRVMDERSADSKRGLAISNSAMAGTRKVADGRWCSTASNQASTSKRGRYSSRMPSFIGL